MKIVLLHFDCRRLYVIACWTRAMPLRLRYFSISLAVSCRSIGHAIIILLATMIAGRGALPHGRALAQMLTGASDFDDNLRPLLTMSPRLESKMLICRHARERRPPASTACQLAILSWGPARYCAGKPPRDARTSGSFVSSADRASGA